MPFELAVQKISLLQKHNTFIQAGARLKLIGLIERDKIKELTESKYIYAPFGKLINEHHKGIFIGNNPNIKKWLESKGDGEKLLRDIIANVNIDIDHGRNFGATLHTSQRLKGKHQIKIILL